MLLSPAAVLLADAPAANNADQHMLVTNHAKLIRYGIVSLRVIGRG